METTAFDYALLAGIGILAAVCAFKGLSGLTGILAGCCAAIAAWIFLLGPCLHAVVASGLVSGALVRIAAAGLDLILSVVAFGIAHRLARRFLSFLVPQPIDALAGMAIGLGAGAIALAILAATAFLEGTVPSKGFMASHSRLVGIAAPVVEASLEGRGG